MVTARNLDQLISAVVEHYTDGTARILISQETRSDFLQRMTRYSLYRARYLIQARRPRRRGPMGWR